MDKKDQMVLEELESDFHKIGDKMEWTDAEIEKMKNIQKLMYYMEVRYAMKEGSEYPGSDYMEERMSRDSRPYDGRNSYERGMMNRGSGTRYMGGRNSYGMPYGYASGRRYYDGAHENAKNDFRQMMSMEQDPDKRELMEEIMHML